MIFMMNFVYSDHSDNYDDDGTIMIMMTTFVYMDHLERLECLWHPFINVKKLIHFQNHDCVCHHSHHGNH